VVKDFGLATFIACVGLSSGPQAIALVQQYGVALPIAGILITLIPATVSFVIGWKLLKLEAPILLGCVAGQQCSTPAISAIQQAAGNSTPLIGYTIVYALSNVLLPLLGPIIVGLSGSLA
jgi:putative transport protein